MAARTQGSGMSSDMVLDHDYVDGTAAVGVGIGVAENTGTIGRFTAGKKEQALVAHEKATKFKEIQDGFANSRSHPCFPTRELYNHIATYCETGWDAKNYSKVDAK